MVSASNSNPKLLFFLQSAFFILIFFVPLRLNINNHEKMTVNGKTYQSLGFLLLLSLLLGALPHELTARHYMMRLTLKDKQGTLYSLQNPEAFLSQRAIERRARQHLALDSTDLPVSQLYLDRLAVHGAKIVSKSKWNNSVLVYGDSLSFLESLGELPFVRKTELVYIADSLRTFECPRRTKEFDELKGDDDATRQQLEQIHLDALHKAGFRGKGMVVAVLDGGFQYADHIPALKRINKVGERDFVFPPSHNIYREHSHGMKVLSVMAVHEKGLFEGAAPEADYWLLRCEQTESENRSEEDFWAAAAEFADSVGVDVINSSLGYSEYDEEEQNYEYRHLDGHTMMISRMASMLAQKGIVLVCSAGNSGNEQWKKITIPADADDVLTVGAVTSDGENTAFSSVGPTADGRVKPDVMAMGGYCSVINAEGEIAQQNGTSFASPLVAGAVACLWQALPDKTACELIELIRRSGDRYQWPDNIYGYGIPDFGRILDNERKKP